VIHRSGPYSRREPDPTDTPQTQRPLAPTRRPRRLMGTRATSYRTPSAQSPSGGHALPATPDQRMNWSPAQAAADPIVAAWCQPQTSSGTMSQSHAARGASILPLGPCPSVRAVQNQVRRRSTRPAQPRVRPPPSTRPLAWIPAPTAQAKPGKAGDQAPNFRHRR